MSELNHLAEVIEKHFTDPKPSSFIPFVVVSDGLTGEQAAQIPAERFNSIWGVTDHMAFWVEFTRTALVDEEIDLTAWGMEEIGGGWPPIGPISDANWLAARQRALDVCHAFAAAVRTLDEARLEVPLEKLFGAQPYQAILAIYGHNCHHTAEVLTIRHMLGLWVDHEWA